MSPSTSLALPDFMRIVGGLHRQDSDEDTTQSEGGRPNKMQPNLKGGDWTKGSRPMICWWWSMQIGVSRRRHHTNDNPSPSRWSSGYRCGLVEKGGAEEAGWGMRPQCLAWGMAAAAAGVNTWWHPRHAVSGGQWWRPSPLPLPST